MPVPARRSGPVAWVTGASRRRGIAAAIALGLAASGWDVATTYWRAYDATMPWGSTPEDIEQLDMHLRAHGATTAAVEADLADVTAPARVFAPAGRPSGPGPPSCPPTSLPSTPAIWTPPSRASTGT